MPTEKRSFNLRISPEAHRLIEELSQQLGISKSAVFEIAVRRLAEEEALRRLAAQEPGR